MGFIEFLWSLFFRYNHFCWGTILPMTITTFRQMWPPLPVSAKSKGLDGAILVWTIIVWIVPRIRVFWLVVKNNHLEKWWSSSMGLGWHPYNMMENKTCLKPPTSVSYTIWMWCGNPKSTWFAIPHVNLLIKHTLKLGLCLGLPH